MTTPVHLRTEYHAIKLLPDTISYELHDKEDKLPAIMCYIKDELDLFKPGLPCPIVLPNANWQIVCTSKECTEEDVKEICGIIEHVNQPVYYKVYEGGEVVGTTDHLDSIRSLLQSKGCDPSLNWLILRKHNTN